MNQRKIFVSSGLGVLRLVFALLGGAIPGLLGIPGTSGVINILWAGGFLALPALITRTFGAATIAGTVYSILALPLPLSGPSGFLPKILIGFTTGLVADLIFKIAPDKEKIISISMGAVSQTVLGIEFALLGLALQIPAIDKYVELQFSFFGMTATILGGALSGFLGWVVYNAIKDSSLVKRAQI